MGIAIKPDNGNNPTIEKRKGIASANPRKRILCMQRSLEPKNGTDRAPPLVKGDTGG
jgi:hypothetical protein